MVKSKTGILPIFTGFNSTRRALILPVLALLTFIFSWLGAYPSGLVEHWYARTIYPEISWLGGRFADSVPFAWLDPTLIVAVILLLLLIHKRR